VLLFLRRNNVSQGTEFVLKFAAMVRFRCQMLMALTELSLSQHGFGVLGAGVCPPLTY
jgi:hypothetical protein